MPALTKKATRSLPRPGWLAVLAAGLPLALVAAQLDRFLPSKSMVSNLEKSVTLPRGAAALTSYERSYSGKVVEGHRKIEALYELGKPKIHILKPTEDLPVVFDGGCGVIELLYDVEAQKVEYVRCHGNA